MHEGKVFDEFLILQYNDGDHKAIELLIKRWNPKLIAFSNKYVHNTDVAKDIVQEVWIKAIKGLHKLKDVSKFKSWIFRITYNLVMDTLAEDKKRILPEEVDQSNNNQDDGELPDIKAFISQLPVESKIVLQLFYLEGLNIADISDVLKVPKGTVKSRIFYAREKLKTLLKQNNYEN